MTGLSYMKNKVIVEKIIKYIHKILSYVSETDYDSFVNNVMLVDACVFNLGQIGELANKIDKEFEESHSQIPWRILYGLRNKIVHDYEGVNLTLIWDIISSDLPELNEQLNELYENI